ncbi:MAG: hypothetical protein ABSE75_12465 [Acidimicrobiales bacterium]|jgi:hypothetical protein
MRRTFGSVATITTVVAVMLAPSASFATSISASKLSSELLTLGQMPTGWSSSSTTDDGLGCLHNLLEPSGVKQTHASQAYFLGTVDQLPKFDEKIATYANVKTAYKKIIARINSCHVTDGLVNGVMVTGTVAPMSFAHFGNASSTYAMVDSDVRGTLHYDYTIVRKGNIVAAFLEGSFPSVVASEFESLVSKGVSRLS